MRCAHDTSISKGKRLSTASTSADRAANANLPGRVVNSQIHAAVGPEVAYDRRRIRIAVLPLGTYFSTKTGPELFLNNDCITGFADLLTMQVQKSFKLGFCVNLVSGVRRATVGISQSIG